MGFIDGFIDEIVKLAAVQQYKTHPWHGISTYNEGYVNAYIEIVPTDTVKYELDKTTGHLKIDRPQLFSNICPTPYGFIPMTYCGNKIGQFAEKQTKRKNVIGDGDPLDICILTEKVIPHGDLLLQARPIGGMRMIDTNEADDKIIAVLKNDILFGKIKDINEIPSGIIDRLKHYFLTYKQAPNTKKQVEITHIYDSKEAEIVIKLSQSDYEDNYASNSIPSKSTNTRNL